MLQSYFGYVDAFLSHVAAIRTQAAYWRSWPSQELPSLGKTRVYGLSTNGMTHVTFTSAKFGVVRC
jgi:hypothetical protein